MFRSFARSVAAPLGVLFVLSATLALWSQSAGRAGAAPVVGESARYCNPLPLETSSPDGSPQGVNLGAFGKVTLAWLN